MNSRFNAVLLLILGLPTAALANVMEDNVQYSAHAYDEMHVSVACEKAAPVTFADGSLSVDWARLALQVAAGAAASPATRTSGGIAPPPSPVKCESSHVVQNP